MNSKEQNMSFCVLDEKSLEKYISIWHKTSNMEKVFNTNPVDKGKFINTMIKCFQCKMITDFYDNKKKRKKEEACKIGSCCFCLPELVLDSVYRMENDDDDIYKYFPQIYLEKCKYEEIKNIGKKNKSIKEKIVIPKNYDEHDEIDD